MKNKINLCKNLSIKVIVVFIAMQFTFCSFKKNDFRGIGVFSLNTRFDAIKSSKKFIKTAENEFSIGEIILTENIGEVRGLTVQTKNNKIQNVCFYTNFSQNRNDAVDDYFNGLKERTSNAKNSGIVAYETLNKKISFSKQKMSYGFTKYTYGFIE